MGRSESDRQDAAARSAPGSAASQAPPAVMEIDARGIVVGWSAAAEDLLGHRAADVVGRESVSRVLDDGVPHMQRELRLTSPDRREERIVSTYLFRLDGAGGRPVGVCSVTLDITGARNYDRLSLLREAGTRIGSALDVTQTSQELTDLVVPVFADYATIDLSELVLPGPQPLARLESTESSVPAFLRAALTPTGSVLESLWPRGEAVYVAPSSPYTEVLSTGLSHFEPEIDLSPGGWLRDDPERERLIHDIGAHSMIVVPLKARGDILGIVQMLRATNRAPFTRNDLDFAERLAGSAALSLDSARQYTREHLTALALQRDLLPRRLTGGGAVDLGYRYLPADLHAGLGGDFYDAIPLSGGRIALVIGDVTGHGINAAATMGRMRTALATLSSMGLPPGEVLARLDQNIATLEDGGEEAALQGTGATCLYAVYDPSTRHCTMASAGHPPPAVIDPQGRVTVPRPPTGTPLGLGMGDFPSLDIELAEGSVIILYTDGLIETREADIEAGIDRLATALATAPSRPSLEEFCDTVIKTMIKGQAEDDIAVLMARTAAADPRTTPI